MMKTMLRLLAPVSMVMLLIFAGPGYGSEYFPLREGFTAEFTLTSINEQRKSVAEVVVVSGSKEKFDGLELTPMTAALKNGGEYLKMFHYENEEGILLVATQEPGDKAPKRNKSEEWEFKYPIAVGTTWTEFKEVDFLKEQVSVTMTSTIEKIDDVVTVPAGNFERCLKIREYFSGKVNLGSYGGEPEVTVEEFTWYAPGVGSIKHTFEVKCSNPKMGGGKGIVEMTSYKN